MKVACIQTNPQEMVNENLEFIFAQTHAAKHQGAELVVYPEMFSYMGDEAKRIETKSNLNSGIFSDVQKLAKDLNLWIVAGSHAETAEQTQEKVYNTCVVYDSNGNLVSTYRKLHLFNLIGLEGKKLYCESDSFAEGKMPKPFILNCAGEDWKALTIICYDIRFPEIIRQNNSPIDVLFVTAAFTWQTGRDHWELLLRARAIENQCYVVACNQTGFYTKGQKRNYGNSMVIDPWGQVLARLDENCGIVTAELSKEKLFEYRYKLPALKDRKIFSNF